MAVTSFMSRLLFALVLLIIWLISGCSAKLSEQSFIAQSETVAPLTQARLNQWQLEFAQHTLSKVSLSRADSAQTTHESAVLNGIYFDHADSNDVIFFIQGNGMKLAQGGINVAKTLAALNKDIIIFDHRGVGFSSGNASIKSLAEDAQAQLAYIQQHYQPNKLIVHGFSLGSFIAARISNKADISALILQGSATNVDDWIDARTPWYSKPFITIEVDEAFRQVDNLTVVEQQYTGPLLVIAGEQDNMAPAQLSTKLFNHSQSKHKELLMVEGASHSNMLLKANSMTVLSNFLSSL